jgi:bisphosphoglycerate-dependent phosphoglycerate mutase
MANMARSMKDLQIRWQEVRAGWKDQVADKFEEKYIKSWERDFRSTFPQIESMSTYLGQVRRDCE